VPRVSGGAETSSSTPTLATLALALGVCAIASAGAAAQSESSADSLPSGQGVAGELDLARVFTTPTLMGSVRPERLAEYFLNWGPRSEEILVVLSRELALLGPASAVGEYLVATSRAMADAIDSRGSWSQADLENLLTVGLVDPGRFVENPSFRYVVSALLRRQNIASISDSLRLAMMEGVNDIVGVDYDIGESVASAWGLIERPSTSRFDPSASSEMLFFRSDGPIEATIVLLTSQFVGFDEAATFLAALQRYAPDRDLVVLVDRSMGSSLEPLAWPRTHLIPTLGVGFTPWARDPMLIGRHPDGGVDVLVRPNRQPGREADSDLGRMLLAQLPRELDSRWRTAHWRVAETPFHNGQILLTPLHAWLSIHSLERRILELLERVRVPIESFTTAEGIDRYLDAAEAAAAEVGAMFGRQPRFVHPLPRVGASAARRAELMRLAGGGGFDLDSLLTVVPSATGARVHTILADLDLGLDLIGGLSANEVGTLRATYGMDPSVDVIGAIAEASSGTRARTLDEFLEALAVHLAESGTVTRVPLLLAPTRTLAAREELQHKDFVIGWNNVVLSTSPGGLMAEGFGSGIERGDDIAAEAFDAANVRVYYLPPLTSSVIRNGGYRCATNHLRAARITS